MPKEEKIMETKTRKKRAARSIFDERLFAIPDKRIVDATRRRNSY